MKEGVWPMKRTQFARAILVALMILLCGNISALAAGVQTLQAEGYGVIIGSDTAQARDEAIIDARVRALEQVAGVYVDSSSLVENMILLDSMVRDRTQGMVASYKVLQEAPTSDGRYRVRIEAKVVPEEVKQKIQGLTSEFAIVVIIPETNLGKISSPPIVENAVVSKLVEAGYRVADPSQVLKIQERERMKALLENDLDTIRQIAARFMASFLVMGTALSEPSQTSEGIVSSRARTSIRVVEAGTGRIIINKEIGELKGFDVSLERAGQKALRNAGDAIADYLLEQMDQHFKRKERTVEIRVRGLASAEEFQRLKLLLQSLRWVTNIQEKRYDPGESLITVRYPEKTVYLAGRLVREGFRLVEFDRTRMVLEAAR